MGRIKNADNNNRRQTKGISFSPRGVLAATAFIVSSLLLSSAISSNQIFKTTVFAQTTPAAATATASSIDTFDMSGAISSLVFGVAQNTKTIDMSKVQKFILSGDWSMNVNKGKLTNFVANFYTGHVNGANNHTHQLTNFRVNDDNNNSPIKLTSDKSTSISGILNVGTNGKKAWNNVNATIVISKGRTIAINLDDNDTQRHFMGQQIYGVVEKTKII
jgi:hypothetical protein